MDPDERLSNIEESLKNVQLRLEQLELALGDRAAAGRHQSVDQDDPATTSDQPSNALTGHSTAADEATPTVPSAASISSTGEPSLEPRHDASSPPSSPPIAPPIAPPTTAPIASHPASTSSTEEPAPKSAASNRSSAGFEKVIGTRITAIVGGLLVVAAAAFFAKLAFDRGWIGAIPPLVRALLIAGAGLGMLVPADLLRRRLGNPAAVGLALAGIGTMYVDGWAMGPVLGLVGPVGSLVAMAVAASMGLVVTIRFGSRLIGASSLLAAVLAPYFAGGEGSNIAAGIYFAALFVVAFSLSMIRPRPFLGLRWISFGILVLGSIPWLMVAIQASDWNIVLVTTIAWWFVIHVSSIHSAHRGFEWRDSVGLIVASTALIAIPVPIAMRGLAVGSIEGWVPLGLGWLCVAFVFQSGVGLGAFKQADASSRRRDRCMHVLASTMWLEGLTLAMVSLALLLPAFGIPIAWAATALALGYHGRRFKSLPTVIFAGILVLASQFAASIVTLMNWGGRDWFDGTPFEMEPVPEAIGIPFAWVASLVLATIWPRREASDPGDGRGWTTPWSSLLLVLGFLPLMIPALFIGEMGWWLLVSMVPFVGVSLVERFSRENMSGGLFASTRALAIVALLIGFLAGTGATIDVGDRAHAIVLVAYAILPVPLLLLDARDATGRESSPRKVSDAIACIVVGMVTSGATITLFLGELTFPKDQMNALAIGSIGLALGPLLLGELRWRGTRIIRPSVLAGMSFMAMAMWLIGVVNLLGNQGSFNEDGGSYYTWVWTSLMLLGMLCYQAFRYRDMPRTARAMVPGMVLFMGLATGSIFLYAVLGPRTIAAQAGLSIWWAIYAIVLVVGGFMKAVPVVRHCGLGLLGVAAIKFLILDLSETQPEFRVVSALGIGLLMVGTSVVYARFGRRLDEEQMGRSSSE